jgi:hypothetical protein
MMMFALAKNRILTGCFTPCAADHSLLKTSAVAERRAVARRVFLYLVDGLVFLNNPHPQRLQAQIGEHDDFNTPWSFGGETSLRKTQQHNLNMKGRNQRQINE